MTSSADHPGEFRAGDVVDNAYIVLAYLGRGAMGHVYHVRHQILAVEYALKTLSSDKVTDIAWKRFQNEAQATAVLTHPNIVNIFNLGLHEGHLPYYIMDLLHGTDLSQVIKHNGPLAVDEAAKIFVEVCSAISFAHKKGIIHRDIKPGNIFLLERPGPVGERLKIVDFGLAKLTEARNSANQGLTAVGDVVGTPYYMSPEQCAAERVDARSDIYSVGCTLFETIAGVPPFRGRNPTEIMMQHYEHLPPTLNKASGGKEFPERLERIIAVALAKKPADRYQTIDLLSAELLSLLNGEWGAVQSVPAAAAWSGTSATTPEAAFQAPHMASDLSTKFRSGVMSLDPSAQSTDSQSKKKQLTLSLLAGGVLVVAGAGGFALWQIQQASKEQKQSTATAQTPAAQAQITTTKATPGKVDDNDDSATGYERQIAAIGKAQRASLLKSHARYCTVKTEAGKTYRVFDFPTDIIIGKVSIEGKEPVDAVGHLKFPIDKGITFIPSPVVETSPECLAAFRGGDIYSIEFGPQSCNQQTLDAVAEIPDVAKLDFAKTDKLTKPAADSMRKFQNLDVYVGARGPTDGALLAKADCWNKVHQLYLPYGKNVSPLLSKLLSSGNIERLGLGPSSLSRQDYKTIAAMKKLVYLDLNGNGVTDDELQMLEPLYNLQTLNLLNSKTDIKALATIKKFTKLERLYISSPEISSADFQTIKTALPHVKLLSDWH